MNCDLCILEESVKQILLNGIKTNLCQKCYINISLMSENTKKYIDMDVEYK